MKRRFLPVLCILPMLFSSIVGCSEDDFSRGRLDGTQWRLVAWSVSSLHPGDFTITADFSGGRMSGTAAVNLYGGPYSTTAGGGFSVGSLSMTEMAGPEDAMRAEALYVQLLLDCEKYQWNATQLTLYDANGNELLIFRKR
ncbi:MAG: META domain-containing protein [Bacteroidia bacterium]|nr:META domain-containing protein [Bacteroidia bacterium]